MRLCRSVSAVLNLRCTLVGNGFIRSVCHGFVGTKIYSCREQACLFRVLHLLPQSMQQYAAEVLPFCLPLAELEGKVSPLVTDEVLLNLRC